MKQFLLIPLLMFSLYSTAKGPDKIVFQAEVLNRHYWRGFVFGESPAVEPQVTMHFNRFALNIWAANTLDNSYSEIDFIPSYTIGNYKFSVFDYYNPVVGKENRFFDFSETGNRHSGEFMVAYNGLGKIPLKWTIATFFYGDRHPVNRNHMFSTYLQLGYPFRIAGSDAEISAGISPWESYYTEGPALIHTGFSLQNRIIADDRTAIPIKISVMANPSASDLWVIFSLGLIRESIRE